MAKGFKKKNSKGGHDFIPTEKKIIRSSISDGEPYEEYKDQRDMYDENEKFAEDMKNDFYNIEKRKALVSGLNDADRRYEIGVSRMSEITKRVHELEVDRNKQLKRDFILNEIEKNSDPVILQYLQDELNSLPNENTRDEVYREVVVGYKPMSRRKNELQEERNQYVKEIEELDDMINK